MTVTVSASALKVAADSKAIRFDMDRSPVFDYGRAKARA
jgi:hypothetical protein